jgi:hypothetical protein
MRNLYLLLTMLLVPLGIMAADISHTNLVTGDLLSTDRFPMGRPSSGAANGAGTAYTANVGQITSFVQSQLSSAGRLVPSSGMDAKFLSTIFLLSEYADLQTAVDAASAAGGGTVLNAKGATISISTTFVPKNNVGVDLNGGTLAWTGGASGVMVENDITTYGAKFTRMFNGKIDPGANVATVFKFHSLRSGYYGDLALVSGNTTMTFMHLLADAGANDPTDGVRNTAYNTFGPFVSDSPGAGVPKVRYGIVLEGTNTGGFKAVTNNTFNGPMTWFVTDGAGYRFMLNSDTNEFPGFHYVTLTTNDANGAGIIFNDTATPSVDADVWGEHFEYFGTGTWYQVAGKKSVVINKAGAIKIDSLNNDAPAFWGSNLVVDNYSDSHDITVFDGSGTNTTTHLLKGNVKIRGTGNGVIFSDDTQVLGMTGSSTNAASATGTPSDGCAEWLSGDLTSTGSACGSGGSMVYPGAGVPNSTGSAWGTSYTVGTGASNLVQLNGSSQLPAVSGALLTNLPSQLTTSAVTIAPSSTSGTDGVLVTRGTPDVAGASRYKNLYSNLTFNAASPHASSEMAGMESFLAYSGGGTMPSMYGFFASPRNTGVGTVTNLVAYQSFPRNSSTGTVSVLKGFQAKQPINAGTISTGVYGVEVENQGLAGVGTTYGIYIGDQTTSTNPYSIYTNAGLLSFGDALNLRNMTAPSAIANNVRLYNVEGDYLHVLDEDSNDHTIGQGKVTAAQLVSTIATGTAPLVVASTTEVANLKSADSGKLNGQAASYYATAASVTGIPTTTYTTAQFDKTDSTLAVITGLPVTVEASGKYAFRAVLHILADSTGGLNASMGGTATATSVVTARTITYGTSLIHHRLTALGSGTGMGSLTVALVVLEGQITVNAGGTLSPTFSQFGSSGTSSVLAGSTFTVTEIP